MMSFDLPRDASAPCDLTEARPEPIAVVGMALRVPGANTPEQFWRNIVSGTDSLARPSVEELRRAGIKRSQRSFI